MVMFFVINETERSEWEKKFQVPHGYYTLPFFKSEEGAIEYVNNKPVDKRCDYIVERWENGEVDVVYQGSWFDTEEIYN
jgi:uncharacterized protein YbdZ (MbtH family)